MNDQPIEVRRCKQCGEAAVVLEMDWQHEISGIKTNESTKEYRCQHCGARFVRWPRSRIIAHWVIGIMLALALVGLVYIYRARKAQAFDRWLPVVPGALPPPIRYPSGPPLRVHGACGGPAKVIAITRRTHNGIPEGTEVQYQCTRCQATFFTENALAHVVAALLAAAGVGFAALFFFLATSPGWRWGGVGVCLLAGLVILGQSLSRLLNRVRNPVIHAAAWAASIPEGPGGGE